MTVRLKAVASASLLLAGCANPILRIDAPGYSPALSRAPTTEPQSMDQALQKLNHFRAAYYEAVRLQTGEAQNATTGLVWLGTLIAGLAMAEVHRDAILGATLLGGTTYGLVRTQIDARRLDVWTNGIEALDCAREASLPLDLSAERVAELKAARQDLGGQRLDTQKALEAVRAAMLPLARLPKTIAPTQELVTRAAAVLAEADATQAAAIGLLESTRGRELSAAVDRVHSGVTRAMKDIAVDPKSIKPLIAGLGGFAEVFAPSSGLSGALTTAFDTFRQKIDKASAGSQAAGDLDALTSAVDRLQDETPKLTQALERTRALLKDVDLAQVSAALKRCNVAGVSAAMTLEPTTLAFAGAGSQGFEIKGGTPPYQVKALGALPAPIAPVFAGGFADTVEVKLGEGAPPGEYRLRVTDSSPTMRSQQLVVTVAATGTATPTVAPPAAATAVDADWKALLAAVQKPGFSFQVGPTVFSVKQASRTASGLQVTLNCTPAPDPKMNPRGVRDKLAAAEPDARKRLETAGALSGDLAQIDVAGNLACVSD